MYGILLLIIFVHAFTETSSSGQSLTETIEEMRSDIRQLRNVVNSQREEMSIMAADMKELRGKCVTVLAQDSGNTSDLQNANNIRQGG